MRFRIPLVPVRHERDVVGAPPGRGSSTAPASSAILGHDAVYSSGVAFIFRRDHALGTGLLPLRITTPTRLGYTGSESP